MWHAAARIGAPIDAWPLLLAEDDRGFIALLWHTDKHFLHPCLGDDVGVGDAEGGNDTFEDTSAVAKGENRLSALVRTRGDFFQQNVVWPVLFQELDDPD